MKTSPVPQTISKSTSRAKPFRSSTGAKERTSAYVTLPGRNGDSFPASMTAASRRHRMYQRRYYLIRRLRGMGYRIETERRCIHTPYSSVNEIPPPDRYYVRQLLKLGFQQELTLF
ncbi:hypothetical protein [Cyclobacterium xiamenense]|uniref:hypothetical protein n=1 Tax=Cyclobacterium xiamenense TaxID=1297121 RepID=UPI0035CEABC7